MWRKFIIPMAIAGLAWLSLQWLNQQEAAAPAAPQTQTETPDAYMEGVVSRRMDTSGRPTHEIRAKRASHFARGDRTTFTAPRLTVYRDDGPPWTLRAERGEARGGNDEILLTGKVVIRRAQDPARPQGSTDLEVRSRDLRILSDEQFAETDQPVTLLHRHGRVSAVGMKVWFRQERLQLLSQVNGIYDTTH